MTLEPDDYLAALRREAAALAAAARSGFDPPVPTCPGWTVGDLLVHVGVIHRRAEKAVRTQATMPVWAEPEWQVNPERPGLVDWYEQGAGALLATLESAGPDSPVQHWFPGGTASTFFRRMAHETAVHRWDAENAHGQATPIEAELAADGVDEMLDQMLPHVVWRHGAPAGVTPTGERFHIHRTDGPGEWLVVFTDAGVTVSREHAKGDLALRGPASDLVLFLWRRAGPDTLDVFGDPALLSRWAELVPPV